MNLPAPAVTDPTPKLASLARSAQTIATEVEAGQATTPLVATCSRLANDASVEVAGVRAVLVALTPEACSKTLSQLLDQDYHVCKVVVPMRVGYTELVLTDRGFIVESGDQRQEFDHVDSFVAALQAGDLAQEENPESWMAPLRLRLAAPQTRAGLTLLVPDSLGSLTRKPALLSLLADRADVVLVAGEAAAVIPDADRHALASLLEVAVVSQCVVVDAPAAPPGKGWWTGLGSTLAAPVRGLVGVDAAAFVDRLLGVASPLRGLLRAAARQREVHATIGLLAAEIDSQTKALIGRRRLAETGGMKPGDEKTERALSDDVKTRIQADADAIKAHQDEQTRHALLSGSPLVVALKQLAASIEVGDIEIAETPTVRRLSLSESRQATMARALEVQGRQILDADLTLCLEALETTARTVGERIESALGQRPGLTSTHPDGQALWTSVAALARPEVRYKGEMPLHTLLSRLGAARGALMGVMMGGMVLGGLGTMMGGNSAQEIRSGAMMLLFPMFVGGFFWTFVSFRRQEAEQLRKEVERLREGVEAELRRVMGEVLKEKHARLMAWVQDARNQLAQQADQVIRRHGELQRSQSDRDRQQAAERLRTLDARLKDCQRRQQEVQRLLASAAEVGRDVHKWGQAIASGWKAG